MSSRDFVKKKLVFMGTSHFSLKALSAIYAQQQSDASFGFEIVAVYTRAPRPSGRNYKVQKSIVHEFADNYGIKVYTPKTLRSEEQAQIFASIGADVAVVSSYGLIIPQNILDIPLYGFINIHASILPRWRGAAPIQSAILAGDKQSGVTIMKMDAGVDTGDIISMKYADISLKTNGGDLEEKLGNLGAEMIVTTLNNLNDNLLNARKQPCEGATYAPKISKAACAINWEKTAEEILRHIMAFAPLPSVWSEINGIRVKILDADIVPCSGEMPSGNCGEILNDTKQLLVLCKNSVIKITKIQPAGKSIMSGEEFMRSKKNLIGKCFSVSDDVKKEIF